MLTSDFGDARMKRLGSRLHKIYEQASEELTEKVNSFFAKFEELDKKNLALVKAEKMTEQEYKTWRRNKILTSEQYMDLRDTMADRMLEANKIAARYINGELPAVYAHNYNDLVGDVESKLKGFSFDLVDEHTIRTLSTANKTLLPYKFVDGHKDVRWNTQRVNSQVLQGILQGEDSKQIASRLMNVTKMNEESALRNARTAVTSAQNKGRVDAMKQAEDDGVIMGKEWIATKDERTREAHEELDKVVVKVDEPFENSIGQIMYPGDPDADPANTYNCRCTIAEVILGFKPKEKEEVQEELEEETNLEKSKNAEPAYSVKDMHEPVRPNRSDFEDEDAYYTARDAYRAERDAFNQEMDAVVEKALESPRFETKEDFIAWANENNIQVSDDFTDKIDLRAMSETTRTLDEMFERFPEAKSFEFFDFDGTRIEPRFVLMSDADGFMECRGGIAFDPSRFNNFENALRDSLYSAMSGETVMGDGTFSTMVRHEYGHHVESYIKIHVIGQDGIQGLDDWRGHFSSLDEYRRACKECMDMNEKYTSELRSLFNLSGASEYSNQDLRELFAEGFAEWSSGGKSEFGNAFGEFFGRWYK